MSDNPFDGPRGSVPLVRRPRDKAAAPKPVRYTVPSRYEARFPPPGEEFDEVDQVEFAGQFFRFVFVLFIATAGFAAFVLVPMVGRFLSA
jgi:hypothetical protein